MFPLIKRIGEKFLYIYFTTQLDIKMKGNYTLERNLILNEYIFFEMTLFGTRRVLG